jgi:type IV secretory pathway VirD2 relaxase
MFDAQGDEADHGAFAGRCEDDRHHFRFIVSPDDAGELADLRAFTRDLMAQAERDLGTRLDWIAVDHWNTGHPHIHVLVRGRADDGQDLVISRDYIREGLRAQAGRLVTLELGPRTDREIVQHLQREGESGRWTGLDRALARDATEHDGIVDLRPRFGRRPEGLSQFKIQRVRKLEELGLAEPVGPGRWRISADAERTLRDMARRNDIIARLHQAMSGRGVERDAAAIRLDTDPNTSRVLGRLIGRGLDDELKGTAYAVIDGVDGKVHHLRLRDLDAATDAPLGAIVESRPSAPGYLSVRSELSLGGQVNAVGATWLDRQLLSANPSEVASAGFGAEVQDALSRRIDHLVETGLAQREGHRVIFARDLIETLRRRELDAAGARLAGETGAAYRPIAEGDQVAGVYRQRATLASGRFAMIDDDLGFTLVPWRPDLERRLGSEVSGVALPGGRIDWSFSRQRGLGR